MRSVYDMIAGYLNAVTLLFFDIFQTELIAPKSASGLDMTVEKFESRLSVRKIVGVVRHAGKI